MPVNFFDTNVLVYAETHDEPAKNSVAVDLVERVTGSGDAGISIQVLQETYSVLQRKLLPDLCRNVVANIAASMDVYEPTQADVLEAIDDSLRWQINFWDAMILLAARRLGAATVWSEDLNSGQSYGSVRVQNPFAA